MTRLSEHFTLEALVRSDTAARLDIDNSAPGPIVEALHDTAQKMELVRALLGQPIYVSSGFRCEALERVICAKGFALWCKARGREVRNPASWTEYFARKEHPRGRAVDFECPAFGTPFEVCHAIAASDLPFQKLIWEHTWTHIGWPAPGHAGKREIYTLMPDGSYSAGIVGREP